MGAEAHAEGMRPPNGFRDEYGGFKSAHASVFLRNRASEESQFTGLAHVARNEAFFLVVDFFEFRNDALFDKVNVIVFIISCSSVHSSG